MTHPVPATASYAARIAFMVELAEHLHAYGTTSQRLESAIISVAHRLGLECEPWSNPTGMILTFSDPQRPPGESDTTRVIRLPPGDTNLYKLCEADRIAEQVVAGKLGLSEGHAALRALERDISLKGHLLQVAGFGLAAAGVAGLLRLPWLDIATAGLIGVVVGLLDWYAGKRPQLKEAGDAVAAIVAAVIAICVAAFVAPLNLNTVVIASLIVLMPGMALTNAFSELTSQHLVSGTARFAGAIATLLKLTVGVMIAFTLVQLVGIEPQVRAWRPQPDWVEYVSVLVAAYAFAVLFRADRRDYWLVMLAAIGGYAVSRFAGIALGSPIGVFLSALLVTVAGNGYARWRNRPGAVIRVPGIIMLVPGSISLRSLLVLIQQQDVGAGNEHVMIVLNVLLALIAGLLIGNLMLPARRSL
ncbi:MAG: threonine/serine exporter family protein [Luteimonas sp.]|nr:threonine/serine exporter family protein [Luteimonas sp.]